MAQAYTEQYLATQEWKTDGFGLRAPVIQKAISTKKYHLYRSTLRKHQINKSDKRTGYQKYNSTTRNNYAAGTPIKVHPTSHRWPVRRRSHPTPLIRPPTHSRWAVTPSRPALGRTSICNVLYPLHPQNAILRYTRSLQQYSARYYVLTIYLNASKLNGRGPPPLDQVAPYTLRNIHIQICTSEVLCWISTSFLRSPTLILHRASSTFPWWGRLLL